MRTDYASRLTLDVEQLAWDIGYSVNAIYSRYSEYQNHLSAADGNHWLVPGV